MKNLLFITAFMLCGISAYTQEFSLGPTLGINNAWIDEVPGDNHALLGINAGLTIVYSTEEHWGLGVDLKYSGEGVETKYLGITAKSKLNYLRIPVKIIYFFNSFENDFRPKVYLGPSFGILAGGETKQFLEIGTRTVDSKDLYEDSDLGLIFGTGFNYRIAPRTWLNVDVAYNHGFTDIAKSGAGYNRNVNLNLGVAWGL